MSLYPEHAKLQALGDKNLAVGDFLEWLSSQGYVICSFDTRHDQFLPVHKGTEGWIAEHFGIDRKNLKDEKRAMLEEIRNRAHPTPPPPPSPSTRRSEPPGYWRLESFLGVHTISTEFPSGEVYKLPVLDPLGADRELHEALVRITCHDPEDERWRHRVIEHIRKENGLA